MIYGNDAVTKSQLIENSMHTMLDILTAHKKHAYRTLDENSSHSLQWVADYLDHGLGSMVAIINKPASPTCHGDKSNLFHQ